MIKRLFLALLFFAVFFAVLDSCNAVSNSNSSAPGNANGPTTANAGNEVHMTYQAFVQTSVTIAKGSSLKLIDDVSVPHLILNGSWHHGSAQAESKTGGPAINAKFSGGDEQTIGPFTTAGTYHVYCSYHPGMNLTIIVR